MRIREALAYLLIFSSGFATAQEIPSLTPEQWTQDLQYFAKEIATKHRNPYHLTPKARFDAEVLALEARIPSMKNYEVVVGLQRLAALIGDGHTFVDTSKLYHRLPIEAFWFGDELRVVRAALEYKKAIGTKIVEVGSTPAQHPVKRLIIDMSSNRGGNYTEGREYLIYKITFMPQLNRAGRLFVITGRRTFSAGMTNVTDFRRETEATIVGEPTGARPNGYQENHWFTLPFSNLRASCATLKYRFQPERDGVAIFPDHRIDPDWNMVRTGQDAAINWILSQSLRDDDHVDATG
jgi:hypothetical protein